MNNAHFVSNLGATKCRPLWLLPNRWCRIVAFVVAFYFRHLIALLVVQMHFKLVKGNVDVVFTAQLIDSTVQLIDSTTTVTQFTHIQTQLMIQRAGTEARGFLFGAPVALGLGVGFVPVRKPGKLPRETISETYDLEYGTDQLEIHVDAIKPGDKVLVVDDLLATGGTIEATVKLIRRLGGEVADAAFIINLFDLGGEQRLEKQGITSYSLVPFPGH